MKEELVQQFIMKNGGCFDTYQIPEIQRALANVDDSKASMILGQSFQNPTIVLIVAIILGFDRFFIEDFGLGVLKVLTCYGCGIWWLLDIFTAKKRTHEYNYKKFQETMLVCR